MLRFNRGGGKHGSLGRLFSLPWLFSILSRNLVHQMQESCRHHLILGIGYVKHISIRGGRVEPYSHDDTYFRYVDMLSSLSCGMTTIAENC